MNISQAEKVAMIEALAQEMGTLFDRFKLGPDVATAVLIDCAARVLGAEDEQARPILVQEACSLLFNLTEMYAKVPPHEMPRV